MRAGKSKWKSSGGAGCGNCICRSCLYWWSGRCTCFDDKRAKTDPYIEAHGGQIRKMWSSWNQPGEQDRWCRGGIFYPAIPGDCDRFVRYDGQKVEACLKEIVSVFQDGFISCGLVDTIGCEQCMKEWEENLNE